MLTLSQQLGLMLRLEKIKTTFNKEKKSNKELLYYSYLQLCYKDKKRRIVYRGEGRGRGIHSNISLAHRARKQAYHVRSWVHIHASDTKLFVLLIRALVLPAARTLITLSHSVFIRLHVRTRVSRLTRADAKDPA